ncbi:MAG: ribosome-associated translation inhibitor RaiA [Bacillota bacterium]|nr:ribosome-associated translation inhibitor RaiA [Thermoanaerobacteraceae bacterium]
MQIAVRGKNIKVTDALRNYVEKRLTKLERYLNNFGEVQVTLSVEKENHRVEVTVPVNGMILRGEEATHDMYAAVDMVVEKLGKQIERYKGRFTRRTRTSPDVEVPTQEELPEEEEFKVVRVKRFTMKPMNVDEAIMQMNLLGHSFFVFTNAETETVCVVYRRRDGNYGLIEPEA